MINSIIIVGIGLAGVSAARALRDEGYEGAIHMIGAEPDLAYDRTVLSKKLLTGELDRSPEILCATWYEMANIDLIVGTRVSSIDISRHRVHLESGESLTYDKLILATGADARAMSVSGSDLNGIHRLRGNADAVEFQKALKPDQALVIVGGGLIGCEVATTASSLGANVTILESGDELLVRILGYQVGAWCRKELERLGVKVELNTMVSGFDGDSSVNAVVCADGRTFKTDTVLISIGAEPADSLAREAGIACDRGVIVDACGMSSSPDVYAVGDVASWPLRCGAHRSLETFLNSQAQAVIAASSILGKGVPTPQISTSWTEIAGHRIQMIGDITGRGELITRGAVDGKVSFTLFRIVDQVIEAAISVNATKDFVAVSRLVESRVPVHTKVLQDSSFKLGDLLKAKSVA